MNNFHTIILLLFITFLVSTLLLSSYFNSYTIKKDRPKSTLSTNSFVGPGDISDVVIAVNWPSWSSENKVELYDASNTLIASICDPSNCYVGGSNSVYANSNAFEDCLPNGNGYYLILYDEYGDGWNSAGSVTVTVAGTVVINTLTFPSPGGSGEVTTSSSTFSVSGGGSCIIASFPYTEGFESDFGKWIQDDSDDLDWTRLSGATGSTGTGPTTAFEGSFYSYIEASSPNFPSQVAILNSPYFDLSALSSVSFDFQYHLYGANMGTLELQACILGTNTWSTIWTISGDQGNTWVSHSVNLNAYAGNLVQLRFRGTTGTDFTSDIAIDDIQLSGLMGSTNLPCTAGPDSIKGIVFEDFNYDGGYDSDEYLGVEGITVIATDSLNNTLTTVTDTFGNYSFSSLIIGRTYRIDFTNIPSWASPTHYGGDNGTVTQFIQPGNCANLAVASPTDYCQNDPEIVVPCYISKTNAGDVLVSFPYGNTGTGTSPNHEAAASQIGAVYGLAYQNTSNTLFASAYQKRFSRYGSGGTGVIYKLTSPTDGDTLDATVFVDLNSLYGSTIAGTNPHPEVGTDWTRDDASFDPVGKLSFGDMDISEDGSTLWLINLNDRQLYKIPLGDDANNPVAPSSSTEISSFSLTGLADLPANCALEDQRPFALKYYRGKLYIGLVCTAQSTGNVADLNAVIYEFDPISTSFTEVLTFGLDYARGCGLRLNGGTSTCLGLADWNPWVTSFPLAADIAWEEASGSPPEIGHPQPMLTDIEFADDGSMLIGFRDRFGDQSGYETYNRVGGSLLSAGDGVGDILKADPNANGTWDIDIADYTDPSNITATTESFFGDDWFSDAFADHEETTSGGLAVLKGTSKVVTNTVDPVDAFSGGVSWYDWSTGAISRDYQVFSSSSTTFAKANGLGDLEILCGPAPLEIGNYVWLDENGDGIQDAGELPIDSIIIHLYNAQGTLVAVDTTNTLGQYYFNETNITEYTAQPDTTLLRDSTYYVLIADGNGYTFNNNLLLDDGNAYQLTLADQTLSGHPNSDIIDSDGQIGSSSSPIAVLDNSSYGVITMEGAGRIDHNLDFGFRTPEYDYGDLPDSGTGTTGIDNYETLEANNGPKHLIIDGLFLGDTIDMEMDGVPDAQAAGDDLTDGTDDENGINIFPSLDVYPGSNIRLPLSVTNTTGDTAFIEAWIDWNADGDFDDTNEMVIDLKDNTDGVFPPYLEILVPDFVTTGNLLGFRIRLSNSGNMTPYNIAYSGEVEDYLLGVNCANTNCLPIGATIIRQ